MEIRESREEFAGKVIEAAIKLAVIATLVIWSYQLIQPFLVPVVWGIILAVALEPLISRFGNALGGRKGLAATLFVLAVFAAIIIPTVITVTSSLEMARDLTTQIQNQSLAVPPPPAKVADWPLIGESVHKFWSAASVNLEGTLKRYAPEIKTAAEKILGSVGGGLAGIFLAIISVIIAGVFMAKSEKSATMARKIFGRFAGTRGDEIAALATSTIRGVMQGVVLVAIIQAIMSAIGMVMVGVPAAALWTLLVLICAVSQLPPILILGPVAAYVFSVSDTTPAVLFLIWAIIVSGSDGFLKPMLMGRGVNIPMLVILIGALGGMVAAGIIGLFVGATVLAIMYSLLMAWIDESGEQVENQT